MEEALSCKLPRLLKTFSDAYTVDTAFTAFTTDSADTASMSLLTMLTMQLGTYAFIYCFMIRALIKYST